MAATYIVLFLSGLVRLEERSWQEGGGSSIGREPVGGLGGWGGGGGWERLHICAVTQR